MNNDKHGKRPAVDTGALQPELIVGIGGSAGALSAYRAILDAMPYDTGMAFVIISHMNPTATSQLVKILSRHTKMNIQSASMGMQIRANHVYVIPPNADLLIDKHKFKIGCNSKSGGETTLIKLFNVRCRVVESGDK